METRFSPGRFKQNIHEVERPIKSRKAFRLMGLLWGALLAAATVTPVLPSRHDSANIQIASVYAYYGDEIDIPVESGELTEAALHEAELLAALQSGEADEETWLALMCVYADTINNPAYTSADVRAAFYGTTYPDIGLLQFSSLATMGKYTPISADVRDWRRLPLTEQHYYETREYPDGTDSRLFDVNRVSNDCLDVHGIDTIPPGQNVAFFLSHLPDADAYGGTFTV